MNFAKGAVAFTDVIDTNGKKPDGLMTFADLIDRVELLLIGPNPTKADLKEARALAKAVNQMDRGNPDCDDGSDSDSDSRSRDDSSSDSGSRGGRRR